MVNPAPALSANLTELGAADYLIVNETEAEGLTGRQVRCESELDACIDALLACGFRRVILTLGARGAVLASSSQRDNVAPFAISAVDTTGAGDAFIGSLAVFLSGGISDREAVTRANLYAALSAARIGARKSFAARLKFDAELLRRCSRQGL